MGDIFIIAGTSGSGKSTIVHRLQAKYPNIRRTVSITTRTPREGERYAVDYYFVTHDLFNWLDSTGQLLEYTTYDRNKYGTLTESVNRLLHDGHDVLFNVDKYGVEVIEKSYPNVKTIFLRTENQEEQHKRLSRRGMEANALSERLRIAEEEIAWAESKKLHIITTTPDIDKTLREVEEVLFS